VEITDELIERYVAEARRALPAVFSAGLLHGAWSGGGTLIVDEGSITVRSGALSRPAKSVLSPETSPIDEIKHAGAEVLVLLSRIPAPVINTNVIVRSTERAVAAGVPPWSRRRLLRALEAAGFDVRCEKQWFTTGLSHLQPWP